MCSEKEPEQCFHTKTKQIFRKSVYSSSSCATCEWGSFSVSLPLAGLAAEWSRDLHRDVTVTWHTRGQNPQVSKLPILLEKRLRKWNKGLRPQRALLSRVRCLFAGKLQQWFLTGCLLPPCHLWNNIQQGKDSWQTGNTSGTGSSACLPKISVHPHIQGFHLQLGCSFLNHSSCSRVRSQLPATGAVKKAQISLAARAGLCVAGHCPVPRGGGGTPALCTELG